MVRFSLFGIPIEIQPWFWATGAFLGGAMHANSREGLLMMLLFMVVMFISILVHELGHALTGTRLGGGQAKIVLWGLGGLAYNQGGRFTRDQRFWMIFMGPGAGFLLLALVLLGLILFFGPQGGLALAAFAALPAKATMNLLTQEAAEFIVSNSPKWWFVRSMVWVNLWWGLINLLPVLPLDGGQITDLFVKPQRRMFLVSTITGAVMAGFGLLVMGSLWVGIMFGFLAFQSYKNYKAGGWS